MNQTQNILNELSEIKKMIGTQEKPLTLPEAAEYLGLSRQTVYKMTSRGEVAHFKSAGGKRLSFLREDLKGWLLKHRVASNDELQREADKGK